MLRSKGWTQQGSTWTVPQREIHDHVHTAACTAQSCGETARFICGPICVREVRRGGEKGECLGHFVPSRDALIAYSLRRKHLKEAAKRGTPLDEEEEAR